MKHQERCASSQEAKSEKIAVNTAVSLPAPLSRRRFLKMTLGGLGLLAALEVGGTGLIFLRPRHDKAAEHDEVVVGPVDAFPYGSVTEFRNGRFFLIRTDNGGFLALYRRCPHLGCTINWLPHRERFYCPCHASSFDALGQYTSAPVPRPLDTFRVYISEDQVVVDTTQPIQREHFTPNQLTFA